LAGNGSQQASFQMTDKYVFVSEPLPLHGLQTRKLALLEEPDATAPTHSSAFTQTVLKARELIFTFPELLANPLADQRAIMVTGLPQLFTDPTFCAKCEKLNLAGTVSWPCSQNNIYLCTDCLLFNILKSNNVGRVAPTECIHNKKFRTLLSIR
jgi:hypothetical protein